MTKKVTPIIVLLLGSSTWLAYRWFDRPPPSAPLYAEKAEFGSRHGPSGSVLTDYVAVTQSALAGKMGFIAAGITRSFTHVEHIEQPFFGLRSEATIQVAYRADYAFGYSLEPGSYSVSGNERRVTVKLARPRSVATPAVALLGHRIPDHGILVDEEEAVIELQRRIQPLAQRRANTIAQESAIVAKCEQSLRAFLQAILSKQTGRPPTVVITYH